MVLFLGIYSINFIESYKFEGSIEKIKFERKKGC